jgi:8-oxo-dGTP diphosphatase/2-hydroxy-dATP diphosphatase
MKKLLTLCLVVDNKNILLGMKKRGWGEGRWNGFGGKVEDNEGIVEAAKRELLEESGICANTLEKRGIINFEYLDSGQLMEVHIFNVCDYSGCLTESEEMTPQWFAIYDIPFDKMWPDDLYWLPIFLKNKKFKGNFTFKDKNTIISHNLEVLNDRDIL